ncbi:MAG: hypothetical protein ACHP7D_09065 [Lysobacterales bacterium]
MSRRSSHLARSPQLRVLACLAWLLLVIVPAYSMPPAVPIGMHHAANAAPADHCHPSLVVKKACCDSHDTCCAGYACSCTSVFNAALAMPLTCGFAFTPITSEPEASRAANVPGSEFPPPLRPPAA